VFSLSIEIWFFIILVAMGIVSIILYSLIGKNKRISIALWVTLTSVIILVTAFILFVVVINNRQFPSRVDVSPLSQLTEEQVARIEEVLVQFEGSEYTNNFLVQDFPHNIDTSRAYSFDWQRSGPASMRVNVEVSRDEKFPIHSVQVRMDLMDSGGRQRYVYVANDNNTEVILYYVFTDMPYPVPSSERSIWTDIRIGNVSIRLREKRHWQDLHNDYSSQFIELLVEMLQE